MFDFENAFDSDYYLYFYEDILNNGRLNAEFEFLINHTVLANHKQPLSVLDMACGYGRHANEFAKLGHKVTGLDSSPQFLKVANQRAQEANVKVQYVQGDMRNQSFKEDFDRTYVLFNALGYFNDEENEEVFKNLFSSLKPKGILCFDTYNRDTYPKFIKPLSVVEKEGNFMIDKNSFDTLTGRGWTQRTVIKDGQMKSFSYSVRFFNPTDIQTLFSKIGFSSCSFYGNWDGSPTNEDSKQMIVIAHKP